MSLVGYEVVREALVVCLLFKVEVFKRARVQSYMCQKLAPIGDFDFLLTFMR